MPLTPVASAAPLPASITHEMVDETDRLPVYFSSPGRNALLSLHRPHLKNGMTIPVHWHEYLEFLYLLDDSMTAIVQADTYELLPGDLLIINSGDLHMTRTYRARTPYILIQFSAEKLREFFPDSNLLHFRTCLRAEEVRQIPQLYDTVFSMKELFEEHADGYQLLFTARFYEFLHILYQNCTFRTLPNTADPASRDLNRITDIVKWTQEQFRRPLTLDDAAGHLGISKEYFCRIFKKYTGQTYLEYLCMTRTTRLYEELKTSDKSIPLLMEEYGLTNYKTFLRTFRGLYGTTPQKARLNTALSME